MKNDICAVRGNCEAEVDQMVLEFPGDGRLCSDSFDGELCDLMPHMAIFIMKTNLPPMKNGDILIHGHTHVLRRQNVKTKIIHC